MSYHEHQRDKRIIELREGGYTIDAIASKLGWSYSTVSRVLGRNGMTEVREGRKGCGTIAGYQHHHSTGSVPCEMCKLAHANYMKGYKAGYRAGIKKAAWPSN